MAITEITHCTVFAGLVEGRVLTPSWGATSYVRVNWHTVPDTVYLKPVLLLALFFVYFMDCLWAAQRQTENKQVQLAGASDMWLISTCTATVVNGSLAN